MASGQNLHNSGGANIGATGAYLTIIMKKIHKKRPTRFLSEIRRYLELHDCARESGLAGKSNL